MLQHNKPYCFRFPLESCQLPYGFFRSFCWAGECLLGSGLGVRCRRRADTSRGSINGDQGSASVRSVVPLSLLTCARMSANFWPLAPELSRSTSFLSSCKSMRRSCWFDGGEEIGKDISGLAEELWSRGRNFRRLIGLHAEHFLIPRAIHFLIASQWLVGEHTRSTGYWNSDVGGGATRGVIVLQEGTLASRIISEPASLKCQAQLTLFSAQLCIETRPTCSRCLNHCHRVYLVPRRCTMPRDWARCGSQAYQACKHIGHGLPHLMLRRQWYVPRSQRLTGRGHWILTV